MFQKDSLKTYSIGLSIVALIIILEINLAIFPDIEKTLIEVAPLQAKEMKNRLFHISLGFLILIFLSNFYFWNLESKLDKEEKEIESNLKINPTNQIFIEKLEKVRNKRKYYAILIEIIFIIIAGVIGGFMIVSIFKPLYRLLGIF
ncbi:MAG: hypothetical protein QXX97_07015 [Nitrososphaerota archaeon]